MIYGITPTQAYAIASNIRDGENPAYTVADFLEAMPQFSAEIVPENILQAYVDMAGAIVKEARWHSLWREGMRLFIAHFVTLYLDGTPDDEDGFATRAQLRNAAKPNGAISSKSVGSVSVTYDNAQATSDLLGWAAWKLTTYGVQFASMARLLGKGGMFVK